MQYKKELINLCERVCQWWDIERTKRDEDWPYFVSKASSLLYEMQESGKEYYFCAFMDNELEESDDDLRKIWGEDFKKYRYSGTYFITSRKYWDKYSRLDDQVRMENVECLPDGFADTMESTFEYQGTLAEGIAALERAGFVRNDAMIP